MKRLLTTAFVSCLTASATVSHGVILYSSPTRNTTPPSGSLAGSGWQYQGQWGEFLGTPIAPQYFVTASHVGGTIGQNFSYNGSSYPVSAGFSSPNSDLTIWKINGTFDTFAPLYRGGSENGKGVVVFGRGTQRGTEVRARNGQLKGWTWGAYDSVQSWGTNSVSSIVNAGPGAGSLLKINFDARGGANEAALSGGDSGGAMFLQDGGVWKLAGINRGVDGPFSTTGVDGSGFLAAIFDQGGLYTGGDGRWSFVKDSGKDIAAGAYATRIASNLSWIDGVTSGSVAATIGGGAGTSGAVPEPAGVALLAAGAGLMLKRRRR